MNLINVKFPKLYWVISAILVITGIMMIFIGTIRAKADREKHLISQIESFEHISDLDIHLTEGDIYLQKGEKDSVCTVEFINISDSVEVYSENEKLYIKDDSSFNLQFFNFGFFDFVTSQIKITLPEQEYQQVMIKLNIGNCYISHLQCDIFDFIFDVGDCKIDNLQVQNDCNINSGTGSIQLQDSHAGKTNLKCDIGDCNLENFETEYLEIQSGTGEVRLKQITTQNYFSVDSSIGDVYAENLTCSGNTRLEVNTGDCNIQNSNFSGDVTGSFNIGDVEFNHIKLEGNLDLTGDTGDITVQIIDNPDNYGLNCETGVGDIYLNHVKTKQLATSQNAKYQIAIQNDLGDIEVNFSE
ncbi:MAG: DUF4097 domain-containing protein [Oscillospiraceae bacterium]|nr:DUF4097 domain-containing protein [Oscillospiraceae bacterium]